MTDRITIEALKPMMEGAAAKAAPKAASKSKLDDRLANHNLIVAGCPWYGKTVVEGAATCPEPDWFAAASITARCENGEAIFHEYSAKHPNYQRQDAESKLKRALAEGSGPRTCASIRNELGHEAHCAVCSHSGKISSPIQLGRSGPEKKSDRSTISAEAVKLVSDSGMGLFHDSQNRGYISQQTPQGGWLHYRLKSEAAEHLIQKAYFDATGKPLTSKALRETLGLLEARAIFGGEQYGMALRVGRAGEAIFVDLGRADGQVIRIDRSGWEATYDCSVKFIRPAGFSELPIPQAGGSIEDFKELLQLSAENFTLLLAFIILCLRPGPGFMCLFVEGQQGSGKSFLCDIVKRIVDPNVASKMRLPDTERDLMVQANSIYLPVFDNASGVRIRISDALCMLATGGGFSTRKLFTDDGLAIFNMARPFIINGIGDFAHRPDLLERAIPLLLPALDERQRRTEEQLLRDFDAMLPGLLGALYGIIGSALANEDSVAPPIGFRMADCAKWLAAAEMAVGFAPGELLNHLSKAQTEFAVDRVMENSITAGLLALLEKGPIEETAKGLLTALVTGGHAAGDAFFPKSSSRFSSELKRLQPDLKKADILVEFGQRTNSRKPIRVWRKGQEVMTFGPPKAPF